MPRTNLTPITPLGSYGAYAANAADIVLTAADVANKNQVVMTGNDLLLVQNSGASPYTVTITSVADDYGRTGDVTYTLQAGEYAIFGPFKQPGWMQTDGRLYLEASNAAVKFAVIALPGTY